MMFLPPCLSRSVQTLWHRHSWSTSLATRDRYSLNSRFQVSGFGISSLRHSAMDGWTIGCSTHSLSSLLYFVSTTFPSSPSPFSLPPLSSPFLLLSPPFSSFPFPPSSSSSFPSLPLPLSRSWVVLRTKERRNLSVCKSSFQLQTKLDHKCLELPLSYANCSERGKPLSLVNEIT